MTNDIAIPMAAIIWALTPASLLQAQIIPDASLPVNTIVTQDGNQWQITGGTTAGANLFHSFQEFSLPSGSEAYFNNAPAIENIFTRITGNSISHIDGIIKNNANANLYLLNPNGIIFGANARLNVGGSFFATTAENVVFNDGKLFGIPTADTAPLLTINVPTGLQYGTNAGGVTVQGATLAVPEGKNLALFGGNVAVEGGILRALGGQLALRGFAETGILPINLDGNSEDLTRSGDMAVMGGARLEARDITLAAGTISIGGNSLLRSSGSNALSNAGVAGNILVTAGAGIEISNSTLESVSNSNNDNQAGNFSDIVIAANAGSVLLNGSQINASNFGSGLAGDVIINARDRVEIAANSDISSNGYFGRIFLGAFPEEAAGTDFFNPSAVLISGSRLNTNNANASEAGDIIVNAIDTVEIRASSLAGNGKDGQILIGIDKFGDVTNDNTDDISEFSSELKAVIIDASQITTDNVESQAPRDIPINSGLIAIVSQDGIDISQSRLVASSGRNGKAGGILLGSAGIINIRSNSRLLSDATPMAVGEGGNILIEGSAVVIDNNSVLSARSANAFRGGDIAVATGELVVSNASQILTTAESSGLAGSITINATGAVRISGRFNLQEQQQIVADTFREVGLEEARLSQQVQQIFEDNNLAPLFVSQEQFNSSRQQVINSFLDNGLTAEQAAVAVDFLADRIQSQTALLAQSISPTGTGSGDITINAGSVAMINGALLETSTAGMGNAGNVTITAQDLVELSDRVSIFSLAKSGATGNGGRIEITARELQLTNGSSLEAETLGVGNAGTVLINARGLVSLNRSLILNTVQRDATGNGGIISIQAADVRLRNGSALDAGTFGGGNAGEVRLQVANDVSLANNSFIFSDVATDTASGNGGNITIDAAAVRLTDRSRLETSTSGSGRAGNITINAGNIISTRQNSNIRSSANSAFGTAGEIKLQAASIRLQEQSTIEANTASGNGGNINLNTTNLLQIGQNSVISTNAGTENAPGNGGNIGINARFLVGDNNGDITANAYEGSGGAIKIDALGIFGLENQLQLTPNSDITAFSQENPQLSGEITINSPEINTSGLVDLPKNFLDVTALVNRDLCRLSDRGSSFIITGRGGLPPNPTDNLTRNAVAVEWANISPSSGVNSETQEGKLPQNPVSTPIIVEAQGWTVDSDGIVVLTATVETATPNSSFTHPTCH